MYCIVSKHSYCMYCIYFKIVTIDVFVNSYWEYRSTMYKWLYDNWLRFVCDYSGNKHTLVWGNVMHGLKARKTVNDEHELYTLEIIILCIIKCII